MKNIFKIIIIFLLFQNSCFANNDSFFDTYETKVIKALEINDYKTAIDLSIIAYHKNKKEIAQKSGISEQAINAFIANAISVMAMRKFDNTSKFNQRERRKYHKLSIKYAKLAMKNKTNNLESAENLILAGFGRLDKKMVFDGLNYICGIDSKKCKLYSKEINNNIMLIDQKIKERNDIKKQNLRIVLLSFFLAMSAVGNGMQNYYNNSYTPYSPTPSEVEFNVTPISPHFQEQALKQNLYTIKY